MMLTAAEYIAKSDDELLDALQSLLGELVQGNPYSQDGQLAKSLEQLPIGLRAMGATHHLDVSLTLDSITWHFGNFGEAHFTILTEQGLRELGLVELADCFHEAKELIVPLLPQIHAAEDREEFLEANGFSSQIDSLDRRAWALSETANGTSSSLRSAIYSAWLAYARKYPEKVFPR